MNTFECSNGDRLSKGKIDRNIRYAKAQKVRQFKNDHGYIFCEVTGSRDGYIDISHVISVKYAQETGRTELSWSLNNMRFEIRDQHKKTESMTNQEREKEYERYSGQKPPEIKKRYKTYE